MNKLLPQNWNDTLSLILIILIPTLWILNGKGVISIEEAVSGALISTWTMVVLFYFRRAPPKE